MEQYWNYDNGRVGIGLFNPARPLHVRGASNVIQIDGNSDSSSVGLTRYSTDWSTVYKTFHVTTVSGAVDNGQFQIIDLHNQIGGQGDIRFVIDNAGRVGIGTAAPGVPFHVS